jgi:hypothetical protein
MAVTIGWPLAHTEPRTTAKALKKSIEGTRPFCGGHIIALATAARTSLASSAKAVIVGAEQVRCGLGWRRFSPSGECASRFFFTGDRTMRHSALRTVVAAFAVTCLANFAAAADQPDPTGTWKWSVTFNNQTRESTLKLKLEGDKLTGTMLGRDNQETPIEDAQYKDGEVSFKVTRERDGQKFTIKYKGKVSDDTIKGKSEFDRNGEKRERDWEAKREKKS